ncbi:uncharacterized protein LOC132611561 [Lycium barbarum]|uniref:uncharacterized protein LOC132611561 n=1 Tax=Lycium barbarum TaxID=112863 RepID=UPI00293E3A75|nr:uncharacterized protein LOC132611561 [Lycium barbarum]
MGAFERLNQLKRQYKITFMTLQEPFCRNTKIDKCRRGLGYQFTYANCSNKIWILCDEFLECNIIHDTEQHLTCTINTGNGKITVTAVYAKCEANLREELWDELRNMASSCNNPWMVIGDFNCIIDPDEKRGGNQHRMSESMPLINCMMDCELADAGFIGSKFTWCNGWAPRERIWKRLDRALINQQWSQQYNITTITHLVRTGSDHAPLLITVSNNNNVPPKYFKFLNLWVDEPGFMDVVQNAWNIETEGSKMWQFHAKLKNTTKNLSWWSRNCIGDIFNNTKEKEKMVAELEDQCQQNNNEENRMKLNQANANLIRHYKVEEAFWKQKSSIKWHNEGDLNTRFFHSVMASKKNRLLLTKIKNDEGNWIEGVNDIAKEAIMFFEKQFTRENIVMEDSILSCLPRVIDPGDNEELCKLPTLQEIKEVVFSMNSDSSPGPDGVNGTFYKKCWDIIATDLYEMILEFFFWQ